MYIKSLKALVLVIGIFVPVLASLEAHAWTFECPGNPPVIINCDGCGICACPTSASDGIYDPDTLQPATEVPLYPGQAYHAGTIGTNSNYWEAQMVDLKVAVASQARIADCNGESLDGSPDYQPLGMPSNYIAPTQEVYENGFWEEFYKRVGTGGAIDPMVEKTAKGGLGTSPRFLSQNKQAFLKPMYAVDSCGELQRSALDNAMRVPQGKDGTGESTYEKIRNQSAQEFIACRSNLEEKDGGGPWDYIMMKELAPDLAKAAQNDPNNYALYAEQAQQHYSQEFGAFLVRDRGESKYLQGKNF